MIHPLPRRARPLLLWSLALLTVGAGCIGQPRTEEVRSTPATPLWRDDEVGRTLRTLASAESVLERAAQTPSAAQRASRVADYLAERLRRVGVQPGAARYRMHFWPAAADPALAERPLVAGLVAGHDPFAASEAVLVYAALQPGQPDRAAPAAWVELARVYAELSRYYRFPTRTVVLLMPVGGQSADALEAYRRRPLWPLAQVHAVLVLGAGPDAAAWHAAGVPASVHVEHLGGGAAAAARGPLEARTLAQQGYTWLLPYVAAAPAEGER